MKEREEIKFLIYGPPVLTVNVLSTNTSTTKSVNYGSFSPLEPLRNCTRNKLSSSDTLDPARPDGRISPYYPLPVFYTRR